jgi:hypothetical protein
MDEIGAARSKGKSINSQKLLKGLFHENRGVRGIVALSDHRLVEGGEERWNKG